MKRLVIPALFGLLVITAAWGELEQQEWLQWAQNPQHTGFIRVEGQAPEKQLADIVYDPFVAQEQTEENGELLVHYQVPLISKKHVFMEFKTGTWVPCPTPGSWIFGDACGPNTWNQEIWNEKALVWRAGKLQTDWTFQSDWKPEPVGSPFLGAGGLAGWEPVFHAVIAGKFVYVPGFGGTVWKVDKENGKALAQINPFGSTIDPNTFVSGPLSADSQGNVYYNALKLIDPSVADPWGAADVQGAWLVKVTPDDSATTVTYADLVPGAPGAFSNCPGIFFDPTTLPWPPSPTAVPGSFPCGSQRPAVNVAPAIAPDGTIYTISRGHFDPLSAYLVAVNPDLTTKWQASLQNRFTDGCGVLVPIATAANPNQPNACRVGTTPGVDPTTNAPGSGEVIDLASSTPTVLPDGSVLFGAITMYNALRGHLMKFSAKGEFLGAFDFGWDSTPAVLPHDDTYSIVIKDNHYGGIGLYCSDPTNPICAPLPNGPYYITRLNANLQPEWQYKNTTTDSCQRNPDGSVTCTPNTHPNGFEWCINAPVIDQDGLVYANSEDGSLYVLNRNGTLRHKLFLNLAIGAAYTPLSLGPDGKIYTQNDGRLFVAGEGSQ
jgi:outer membrane protein assembly factor BamB